MKTKKIFLELKHHLPFTAVASILAVIIVATVYLINSNFYFSYEELFHFLHPAHVFVSAIVTAAIFYKYKKSFYAGIAIGVLGSVLIGTLSDIVFPWLGGIALGMHTHLHLAVLEKPFLILGSAFIGSLAGIALKVSKFPHLIHVFLSVFASLFYLIAFSSSLGIIDFFFSTIIVFLAVIIPCCISDIIFPLAFIKR